MSPFWPKKGSKKGCFWGQKATFWTPKRGHFGPLVYSTNPSSKGVILEATFGVQKGVKKGSFWLESASFRQSRVPQKWPFLPLLAKMAKIDEIAAYGVRSGVQEVVQNGANNRPKRAILDHLYSIKAEKGPF